MKAMFHRIRSFLGSEDGPTATEYAVMLALMIVVSLTVIQAFGLTVSDMFTDIEAAITS